MAGTSFLPENWTDEDMERAKNAVIEFVNTPGYKWLANYIGCRQKLSQATLLPPAPGLQPHGAFIEGSARFDEAQQVLNAVTYITHWRAARGKED